MILMLIFLHFTKVFKTLRKMFPTLQMQSSLIKVQKHTFCPSEFILQENSELCMMNAAVHDEACVQLWVLPVSSRSYEPGGHSWQRRDSHLPSGTPPPSVPVISIKIHRQPSKWWETTPDNILMEEHKQTFQFKLCACMSMPMYVCIYARHECTVIQFIFNTY